MRKILFLAAALSLPLFLASAPDAGAQMCEGVVHGLSRNYNPSTGSGFLAVRSAPRSSAHKRGELFNGDRVEIFDRSGNWYKIASLTDALEGWAHVRWIRNECGY